MDDQYIDVELTSTEKKLVMELASFLIVDEPTESDLKNVRKKVVRFKAHVIPDVVGELSYHFNRRNNSYKSEVLDQVIHQLEYHEKRVQLNREQ